MALSTDMLEAFVKVADHLSVSVAATELGTTKGVISKRVAQLEREVRATLLTRNTRKVALTPAGEIYVDFARRALVAVGAADEQLQALRTELSGPIRLTSTISWGQHVLARLIPEFLAAHPGIEIELLLADRLMDIAYERIDIALRATASPAPDLVSIPVARVPWVVCATPGYLAKFGAPREPERLVDHPCMSYWRENVDASWQFENGGRTVTVRVRSRYRANNPEAVFEAVRAGLGIALLPRYCCEERLADGALVPILPRWTPLTRFGDQITAVAAPDRIRFSRNQAFLAFLKARLVS